MTIFMTKLSTALSSEEENYNLSLSAVCHFSNRSILGDGSQWSRDCAMLEKYLELVVNHPVSLSAVSCLLSAV